MASSDFPQLKRASRRLRRFCDELTRQGVTFLELEMREGVDLWPRYVAYTRIGRILFRYDGSQWVLSLALPGARFFALYEDWLEYRYGRTFGGYQGSEYGSVIWLEKLLKQEGIPQIDVAALDRIVEKRMERKPPAPWIIFLGAVGGFVLIMVMYWFSFASRSSTVAGAASMALASFLVAVGAVWRIKRQAKRLGYRNYRIFANRSKNASPRRGSFWFNSPKN